MKTIENIDKYLDEKMEKQQSKWSIWYTVTLDVVGDNESKMIKAYEKSIKIALKKGGLNAKNIDVDFQGSDEVEVNYKRV